MAVAMRRAVNAGARRAGFEVVPRNYSNPVPDLSSIDPLRWTAPRPTPGVDLRLDEQIALLERLSAHFVEFYALLDAEDLNGFTTNNAMYGPVDAEVLFAIVRHGRPRRVVEVGSGYSTLLTLRAAVCNREEGQMTEVISVDPSPRVDVATGLTTAHQHIRLPVEKIGRELFSELQPGDVLFIDSSHVVRTGSDVNFIILELLPALGPGVLVHLHDVFIPWEYPISNLKQGKYWSEQYLLQAFLIYNSRFEVALAANALVRQFPERFTGVRGFRPSLAPGAFWIRSAETGADRHDVT